MKIFLLILILVCTNSFSAEFLFVKGNVFVVDKNKKSVPAKKGLKVESRSTIKVGDKSLAILSFGPENASKMKISPNTELKVSSALVRKKQYDDATLRKGNIIINYVRKLDSQMNVYGKAASMGVRGTTFFANQDENGEFSVGVEKGEIELRNKDRSLSERVGKGKWSFVNTSGDILKPQTPAFLKQVNWKLQGNQYDSLKQQVNLKKGLNGLKRKYRIEKKLFKSRQFFLEGKGKISPEMRREQLRDKVRFSKKQQKLIEQKKLEGVGNSSPEMRREQFRNKVEFSKKKAAMKKLDEIKKQQRFTKQRKLERVRKDLKNDIRNNIKKDQRNRNFRKLRKRRPPRPPVTDPNGTPGP